MEIMSDLYQSSAIGLLTLERNGCLTGITTGIRPSKVPPPKTSKLLVSKEQIQNHTQILGGLIGTTLYPALAAHCSLTGTL